MEAGLTLVLREGRAEIRRGTPLPVEALMLGRPVDEALALLPRLFNLCAGAQGMAFRLSLGLPVPDADLLRREILRDHVAKLCLRWPALLGLVPIGLPAGWQEGGDPATSLLLGASPCPADTASLAAWMESGEGVAPVIRAIAGMFKGLRKIEPLPLVTAGTALSGQAQENSVAARRAADPMVAAAEQLFGRGPVWHAAARLADALAVARGDLPAPVRLADGTAVVPAARGSYALRVRAVADRITGFDRRTPTDHLVAPGGALAGLLSALGKSSTSRVRLLADILDPCIPVQVREGAHA